MARSRPVVLFDGMCPMCSREIAHYRRRRGAGSIRWVDVTRDVDALRVLGIEQREALARFHVRAADGAWHTGAAGFVELWAQFPAYAWLSRLIVRLRLLGVLERAYQAWLRLRGTQRCDGLPCKSDQGNGA